MNNRVFLLLIFPLFFSGNSSDYKIEDTLSYCIKKQNTSFLTCVICSDPISAGQKYIQDYWDNKFHVHHVNEYESCYSCNRLITPEICGKSVHSAGGDQYFDGRWVCNHCIKSGLVFLPMDGETILVELLQTAELKGVKIPHIFETELIFDDQLASIRNKVLRKGEKNPALTSIRLSQQFFEEYVNYNTKCSVYVLSGLQELFFKKCLAHEIMHVWIAVNCSYELHPAAEEGLCNYFSYEILKDSPDSEYKNYYLEMLNENSDPIYGDGFRMIKQVAAQFSDFKDLLTYIQYNPSKFQN